MTILQAKIFVLVAQYGTFSQAADYLYISQSSTSKYISALESELGFALFNRGSKSVTLTRFGEEFLPHAKALIYAENDIDDFVRGQRRSKTHWSVALTEDQKDGTHFAFFRTYLNALNHFYNENPEISVTTRFYPWEEISNLLPHGKVDCAILPIFDKTLESTFPSTGKRYRLFSFSNHLVLPRDMSPDASLEDIGKRAQTLYFIPNDVNKKLLPRLKQHLHSSPNFYPCGSPTELLLRMARYEENSIAVAGQHLRSVFRDVGMPVLDLDMDKFSSSLYVVWEKDKAPDKIMDFCQTIEKHILEEGVLLFEQA